MEAHKEIARKYREASDTNEFLNSLTGFEFNEFISANPEGFDIDSTGRSEEVTGLGARESVIQEAEK